MIEIARWADWSAEAVSTLRNQGVEAQLTFTRASKESANPSFHVDIDSDESVGRIIVWRDGNFDCEVHPIEGPPRSFELPDRLTNENFEAVFRQFVMIARG